MKDLTRTLRLAVATFVASMTLTAASGSTAEAAPAPVVPSPISTFTGCI